MALQQFVVHKWQFHRPVVGQIQRPPFRIVKFLRGKMEIAGLGKSALVLGETEIARRVIGIPKEKLPAEIEEQMFPRRNRR